MSVGTLLPSGAAVASPPLQPSGAAAGLDALSVQWIPACDWDAVAGEWRALADAAEGPVFMDADFALAARLIDPGGLHAFVVSRDGRWIGLAAGRFGFGGADFALWTHPYVTTGGLLCRPGEDRVVARQLIAALAERGTAALYWPAGDDADWNRAAGAFTGLPVNVVAAARRAVLTASPPRLSKEHRRQLRRLADGGRLYHASTASGHDMDAAVEAFLALEAAGWKGRRGTAMGLHPHSAAFFREGVTGLAARGRARIELMSRDGVPVAAGVVLSAGRRAWYWKTAYDEAFARHSPGLLLSHAIGQRLIAEPGIDLVDSCAIQDHPMIDRIWPERVAVTSRLIAVRPGAPGWRYRAVFMARRGLIRARACARLLLRW